MVKLIAARLHRLYGPRGSQNLFEILNAVFYLVATILLLAGFVLLLRSFKHPLTTSPHRALILLAIALCLIILVNLHDLVAHLSGINFRLDLLAHDPQLALVEVGAPLVHTIGTVLFLIAVIFLLKSKSLIVGGQERTALQLLVAGSTCWLLGSLHNACQVYDRAAPSVQLSQKAAYLPLLLASTLFLISSVLWLKSWPHFVVAHTAQYTAIVLAIVASALLVVAAIANIMRVLYLRRLVGDPASPYTSLDTLRGGGREELDIPGATTRQPLLQSQQEAAATTTEPLPIVEEESFAVIR